MPKQKRQPGIHLHKTTTRQRRKHDAEWIMVTEYYWILISKNGQEIARSSKTYKRKGSAVRSIVIAEEIFDSKGYFYDHATGGAGVEEVAIKGNKSK